MPYPIAPTVSKAAPVIASASPNGNGPSTTAAPPHPAYAGARLLIAAPISEAAVLTNSQSSLHKWPVGSSRLTGLFPQIHLSLGM